MSPRKRGSAGVSSSTGRLPQLLWRLPRRTGSLVPRFFWPKLTGGFGADIDAGPVTDLRTQVFTPDGAVLPLFIPEARAYLVPAPAELSDQFEGQSVETDGLMALYMRCVHLGCRVPWCARPRASSALATDRGTTPSANTSGPAPRNLDRFVVENQGGNLTIRTGTIIQTPRAPELSVQYPQGPSCISRGSGMTANIITVIALVAGIAWLGMLFVSAIRNRGVRRWPQTSGPGSTTRRSRRGGWKEGRRRPSPFRHSSPYRSPLLPHRAGAKEGFVEEFAVASTERGQHLVAEFGCFNCHGPEGSGGVAPYVEKRSGIAVEWAAPSLNDVFFRYEEDEVNFWVTYGRGNTPMPAWGIPGGGPLNDQQVEDVVNYLATIQVAQDENLAEVEPGINTALDRLATADATVEVAILDQRQVVAQIESAPDDVDLIVPLATNAREVLDGAGEGIDTDADGLSDAAETELSGISAEAVEGFRDHGAHRPRPRGGRRRVG